MSAAEFDERCIRTANQMTFFGEPVYTLKAERLLVLVGHLYEENQRLKESLKLTAGLRGNLVMPK